MNRFKQIAALQQQSFDLLVIGGGITGAGIALDAAARGLRTALIEKNDFAFGTSSRSTKLIHGGLRYLKQLEFALVKEVGSERAIIHQLAPHLVVPAKMLLPLYEKRGLGYALTSIGLKIYDWLAGVKPDDQRKMLTRNQVLACEPLLNPAGVKGGALYAEYRTDDARLTVEILKGAVQKGARVANYVCAEKFLYNEGRTCGAMVRDELNGNTFPIRATAVVNAAGPWVDTLRKSDHSLTGKKLHLTKGIHIVVPYHRMPVRQAIYFDVPDGRMVFAIPRNRVTYIGTTDTDYSGSLDHVFATHADVEYLLQGVNHTFTEVHLTLADVESTWAGLRPLIHQEGKSASELSRKDELIESPSGLISMAGGKLTGYRKMAERVVDLVIDKFFKDQVLKECATATLTLPGGNFSNTDEVNRYRHQLAEQLNEFRISGEEAANLVHLFGRQAEEIVERIKQIDDEQPEKRLLKALVLFCIECEMAVHPMDFINRRTGMLYFNYPRAVHFASYITECFAEKCLWDVETKERYQTMVTRELQEPLIFHDYVE